MIIRLHFAAATWEKWKRLSSRHRHMLIVVGVIAFGIALFIGFWQPGQHRLLAAQQRYEQRLGLVMAIQRATPRAARPPALKIMSSRLNDSAVAAGLDVQKLGSGNGILRIVLKGDALAVLRWLDAIERDGAVFQSIVFERSGVWLETRLVLEDTSI